MPAPTKGVRESEREAGIIFLRDDAGFLDKELTRKEWDAILARWPDAYVDIDWDKREAWLEANGYEITRSNLRNTLLEPKQPEQ